MISGRSHLLDLEGAVRRTVSALAEIDSWYEGERKDLQSFPENVRSRLMQDLQNRHLRNREPYVRYLAQIYRMMVAERLFGSVDPLPERRRQSLTLR
jgi:hypothetical protein